ncbi:MAG: hypothetical protein JWN82_205 [Candidatus Saccharibacteria bacterium]|nr:hypothetical protein [Candidatus Saccharibacteria bacterium]
MNTPEKTTTIELWKDEKKIGFNVEPPLSDDELTALEWTGAAEYFFADQQQEPPRTESWAWRQDAPESPIPNIDMHDFVIRAWAHQVQMLRELQGHEVAVVDRLDSDA